VSDTCIDGKPDEDWTSADEVLERLKSEQRAEPSRPDMSL
jgi:hypothetical protein